jgi:formate/nitrite transporter FocA (FNT family)
LNIKARMPKRAANPDDLEAKAQRLTAPQIFHAAVESARAEIKRTPGTLAFSGIAGGVTMGLTGLGVASMRAILGSGRWEELASYMIYPIGFIAVIIGRAQLFTENTLYPVVLVLDERRYFYETGRL